MGFLPNTSIEKDANSEASDSLKRQTRENYSYNAKTLEAARKSKQFPRADR